MIRTVKTKFLVLPCPSIYNCIIGRPTLGRLGAVTSRVHLKMKFYSLCNNIITLNTDLDSAEKCFYMHMRADKKAKEEGDPPEEGRKEVKKKGNGRAAEVNVTGLDARYDPDSSEEENDDDLTRELKRRIM